MKVVPWEPHPIIIEGDTQETLADLFGIIGNINKKSFYEIMPSPLYSERLRPKKFFIEKSPLAFVGLLFEVSRQFDYAWKAFNQAHVPVLIY